MPVLVAQVADHRRRLKDRQPPPGLAQPSAGGREDQVVQGPGGQVLEGAVHGAAPAGPGKYPGHPAESPGRIGGEAAGIEADLGVEAPLQEPLQVSLQQVRKRNIDLNPLYQRFRGDAHQERPYGD